MGEILENYNLSYDFFHNDIKLKIEECYPARIGFNLIDEDKNKYIYVKANRDDIKKYFEISKILKKFKMEDSDLFGKYFFDGIDFYFIFKIHKGEYRKWNEFDLNLAEISLKNFYSDSKNILNNENQIILTIGDEVRLIDRSLYMIESIFKIISFKSEKREIELYFIDNKNFIINELLLAKEFFLSIEYREYCENFKNIKFIHGRLSNKSFVFENGECYLTNFVNASIDLFAKDISIFLKNLMTHYDNQELKNFLCRFLGECDLRIHLKVIKNYLRVYKNILIWLSEKYFERGSDDEKFCEIISMDLKQNNFIKTILQ